MSIKDLFKSNPHGNAASAAAILADNLTQPAVIATLSASGLSFYAIRQIVRNRYKFHFSWKESMLLLVPEESKTNQSKLS